MGLRPPLRLFGRLGRDEPGIDLEGHADRGSLGFITLLTPSATSSEIDDLWNLDTVAESLLHRIVVRGQLRAAEYATCRRTTWRRSTT